MKELNKNTQQAQRYIYNYKDSCKRGYTDLFKVYGSYSYSKEKALDYCLKLKNELIGFDGCIASHNSQIFTYAFRVGSDLIYITPSNDYIIKDCLSLECYY